MNLSSKKNLIVGLFLFVLLISIPLTVFTIQQQQETRMRAAGATTLYFVPDSSSTVPIQKNVGDTVALDLTVDPGSNLVTFIKFQLQYDPTKLQLDSTNPFTLNTTAFPQKVEGPVAYTNTVAASIGIGSDPTKAVNKITKVGTVNFKAVGSTSNTNTQVTFTSISQVLSGGSNTEASQNVLSSTTPATIVISGSGTPFPTNPNTTPQPTAVTTSLTFTLLLHGLGIAGDNPNPNGSTLSNKNPLHPQRNMDVDIVNSENQVVATKTGAAIYSSKDGTFVGTIDLGPSFPSGNYNIKIKSDRYLKKLVAGIQKIANLENTAVPATALVAGDVNNDNKLNVLDYNALLDCGYGDIEPLPMQDPNATFNTSVCKVHTPVINIDLDDNGIVNSADYNLFLRELSVQNGD